MANSKRPAIAGDMKRAYIILILIFLTGVLVTAPSEEGDTNQQSRIKFPSDLLSQGSRGITPFGVDFILHPIRDFRLIYCDNQTLQTRIQSGVCVIDVASRTENHKEVKVLTNSTLADVLKIAGPVLQGWQPGLQPSLRIIGERSILADHGNEAFLQTKILPGDFIVLLPTN